MSETSSNKAIDAVLDNNLRRSEPVALSLILSCFSALLISEIHERNTVTSALVYLALFSLSMGAIFEYSRYRSLSALASYSILPVLFFIVVWIGKHLATLVWGKNQDDSVIKIIATDPTLPKLILLSPFAAIYIWVLIISTSIGLRYALSFISDPEGLKKISDNLMLIGAIVGAVTSGLTWFVHRFS